VKIAIVHEWLTAYAGSERVVEQLLILYPEADLFAVCDFLSDTARSFLRGRRPRTTFIQRLPFAAKRYRAYLPLMPLAIEQLDLSGYDLVISSNHAVAKGVLTGPDQLHVSYVHSPLRYAWDLQSHYLREAGIRGGPRGLLVRWLLHRLRLWDRSSAMGVDAFVANSRFIARRIRKVYRRQAAVIYPPVDTEFFTKCEQKQDFYLVASRMVPYKRIPLIVEAFSLLPDLKLVVVGDGPEFAKVKALAGANTQVLGFQTTEVIRELMQRARAFVFAAEEDFGISCVEAQACGTPVIAYGKGGSLETVRGLWAAEEPADGQVRPANGIPPEASPTGLYFQQQSPESIAAAVRHFEQNRHRFESAACSEHAARFSVGRFRDEFSAHISTLWQEFQSYRAAGATDNGG
jgi:O-antigen biosynthesis alpha-1,3-mannosyltransferase